MPRPAATSIVRRHRHRVNLMRALGPGWRQRTCGGLLPYVRKLPDVGDPQGATGHVLRRRQFAERCADPSTHDLYPRTLIRGSGGQ